jgi:hypothetical protein
MAGGGPGAGVPVNGWVRGCGTLDPTTKHGQSEPAEWSAAAELDPNAPSALTASIVLDAEQTHKAESPTTNLDAPVCAILPTCHGRIDCLSTLGIRSDVTQRNNHNPGWAMWKQQCVCPAAPPGGDEH